MNNTLIKIYGTHKRDHIINKLKSQLGLSDDCIVYDDRPNGGNSLYTCEKCWRSCENTDKDFVLCMQDDIEIPDNFLEIIDRVQKAHPTKAVSLFPYIFRNFNNIFSDETPYLECSILMGCAIMMPARYIKPCFDIIDAQIYSYDKNIPDDTAMSIALEAMHIQKICTIPSIIQHIGDDSILDSSRPIRRAVSYKEHCVGNFESSKIISLKEQFEIMKDKKVDLTQ